MKVLAIGDIHTKLDIVFQAISVVDYYDAIVFVGDYADDWQSGPLQTLETWRSLKQFQELYSEKVKLVIGNHDYAYLLSFDPRSGGYNATTQMLLNLPENLELKNWLLELPLTLEIDGVTYSHAGIDVTWNEQVDERSLWADNSPIWTRPNDSMYAEIPQVFGHTPTQTCYEVEPGIWCIDTFSTYRDGTPIGDKTLLEIIDGKTFSKTKMENIYDNNNPSSIKTGLSRESHHTT